ncbi:DUF6250 domain-containing protein [Flavobacterium fluviatile]|uniref:DUF6250 domain-containing protein n=1 Tax=Flavobacterium fluviatile TaxID=1862387 RepID=UPI0013CFF6C6|nr:DUF6250 domain-containing protein [Flavobacterium fluviatile]
MIQFAKKQLIGYISLGLLLAACAVHKDKKAVETDVNTKKELLYSEDFSNDMSNWKVEQMPNGKVEITDEKLEIEDAKGCTVWFEKELQGPIMIEYDAFIIQKGGPHDRVSDLNCFWMAQDPKSPNNLFANGAQRGGKFSNYDSLRLYYVGMGGNDNSSTRFRRYVGNGERPVLPEHDLSAPEFLLTGNTLYHIKIIANGGKIQFYCNGKRFFDYQDANPYTSGHFGFRTVDNHMTIDNFKVYRLK